MAESGDTIPVKYIYLDVASFSLNRSSEAQAEIVTSLNSIVRDSVHEVTKRPLQELITLATNLVGLAVITTAPGAVRPADLAKASASEDNVIYLPTGDGMCIALVNPLLRYDTHIRIALEILERIDAHNEETRDPMRRYKVRIGLNQGDDVLVTDVNGRKNLAGAGINNAQRVMDCADAAQIIVSRTVYDALASHDDYIGQFEGFETETKHHQPMDVFQFLGNDDPGLNTDVPSRFRVDEEEEAAFSLHEAYWFARALHSENEIMSIAAISRFHPPAILVVMELLVSTDVVNHNKLEFDRLSPWAPEANEKSLADLVESYLATNKREVLFVLAQVLVHRFDHLRPYFRQPSSQLALLFINADGKEKLTREFPSICEEFRISL